MTKRALPEVRTDRSLAAARSVWRGDVASVVGRAVKWVLTLGFVGVIAAAALGAWRFSDLFYEDGLLPLVESDHPPYSDGVVVAVGEGRITLDVLVEALPMIERDGTFGIRWPGGHGRLEAIVSSDGARIVRQFEAVVGLPAVGDRVTVDGTTFYRDPEAEYGLAFAEVMIHTEVGDAPAWFVDGESTTWVILTHGKGVDRTEALRMLPTLVEAGHPTLIISYRNDVGVGADPSGLYRFGITEWRDLQSAVEYALDHGAERVVLGGYSMGGGITMEFMHQSPFALHVAGLILDAPMLDLGRTVDQGAADQGIPSILVSLAKTVAAARFGFTWSEINYLAKLDRIEVPVLVFHGTDDERVPIVLSENLASSLPDLVTFVPIDGAGHVESWNVEPDTYAEAVRALLRSVS